MSEMRVLQNIIWEWGKRCFGEAHMTNPQIRALRCAEEVVELCQALDLDRDKMHLLVDTVYARERGHPRQELGGVIITSMTIATALGYEYEWTAQLEVQRLLSKPPEHFAKRNEEKLQLGLD